MKILYLSKTSEVGPSSRYRIYQYIPFLRTHKITCEVKPLFKDGYFRILSVRNSPARIILKVFYSIYRFIVRFFQMLNAGKYDLVIVEHQVFPYAPYWLEQLLRSLNRNLVIEFDDAIYLTFLHRKKMERVLSLSKGVIVGNKHLAEFAGRYNDCVNIIPTVIDTERYQPKENYKTEKIIIAWIGLPYNIKYLLLLQDAFKALAGKYDLSLKIISSQSLKIEGIDVICRNWSYETEAGDLRDSDIGIMPLPDNEWTRGKCGAKLLQYMACGLPVVSSPVGVNSEIINDGENGFLASDIHEWVDKISLLIENESLREKLGRNARITVEKNYSLSSWAEKLADTYYQFYNSK